MKMVDKLLSTNYASLQTSSPSIEFSQREIEVLNLIAEGMTNVEMADKLFISKRTIEGHRQSLIEKTGVRNTASLIKHAIQHGIIQ
jgi:DNA-binding NarL/FixJ family response regulator